MTQLEHLEMPSPVGRLKLIATERALVAILWENDREGRVRLSASRENPRNSVLSEAEKQLSEYFAGRRRAFELPLAAEGTEFQREVWRALERIPFGETRGYAELAKSIGRASAARAVGAANGRNPLSIVVPCHRVIGASGDLTGFAGGLEAKTWLLTHEGVLLA